VWVGRSQPDLSSVPNRSSIADTRGASQYDLVIAAPMRSGRARPFERRNS
jgi:hypothetical protein